MAKFIGTSQQTENWGEDYFVEKLMEYFDDSYVIYRNRPVFGAQFDVCLFAPGVGIIIFEVKCWKPDTIKAVRNGDSIVIRTVDENTGTEGETEENPTTQVRGYVYKMRSKIRQNTGKTPLVYGMSCFPNLTKSDYDSKGLEPVCEYEETILKDDLDSKAAFYAKLNLSVRNHSDSMRYNPEFTPELMFRVRQIFESDLKIEDLSIEDTDLVESADIPSKTAYSVFSYIPHDDKAADRVRILAENYRAGTKLYIAVTGREELALIKREIDSVIRQKGLAADGLDLVIGFSGDKPSSSALGDSYSVFNCSAYLVSDGIPDTEYFSVVNGEINSEAEKNALRFVDENSSFNIEQYKIEHSNLKNNIIVRAGAGTGKTHTMISRIAFICHMGNCSMKEMARRIVMLTFTDEAANQMENKIKQHFENYYLLTGDADCLAFTNQIESMQISTIHLIIPDLTMEVKQN